MSLSKAWRVISYSSAWEIRDMDGRLLEPEEIPLFRAVRFGERSRREFLIRRDRRR